MDKSQVINLIPVLFFVASEIIGLNPRWKSNTLIEGVMSVSKVLISMFIGSPPDKQDVVKSLSFETREIPGPVEGPIQVAGSRAE